MPKGKVMLLLLSPLFTLSKRWRSRGTRLGMEEGRDRWRRVEGRSTAAEEGGEGSGGGGGGSGGRRCAERLGRSLCNGKK